MQQTQTRRRGTNSLLANVIKGALAGAIAVYVIDRMERMAESSESEAWPEPTDAFGYVDEPASRMGIESDTHQLLGLGVLFIKNRGLNALADLYARAPSSTPSKRAQALERL